MNTPTSAPPSLDQLRKFSNPHGLKNKVLRVLWGWVWLLLFRPSPRLLWGWRAFLLRLFGAKIAPGARIYASAQFWAPWNLSVGRDAAIADDVDVYCVAPVTIGAGVNVSKYSFLCSAAHDISDPAGALTSAPNYHRRRRLDICRCFYWAGRHHRAGRGGRGALQRLPRCRALDRGGRQSGQIPQKTRTARPKRWVKT